MNVRQTFNPAPIGANGNFAVTGTHIAGFLPTVGGTLTVTGMQPDGVTPITFINAVPVTAGIFLRLPCEFTVPGSIVQLAGGAAGTLFV